MVKTDAVLGVSKWSTFCGPAVFTMERLEINGIRELVSGRKNGVRTARYTKWNFVPKNLFEQLSQLSNFYFFAVGLLQMLPTVSSLSVVHSSF